MHFIVVSLYLRNYLPQWLLVLCDLKEFVTSNEVHDLQESGADSFIFLHTVSPLNTQQIETMEAVVCSVGT